MIASPYFDFNDRVDSLNVKTKMITIKHMASKSSEFEVMSRDEKSYEKYVKQKLAHDIANLILDQDLVLFTKQNDVATYTTTYRARVFLANKDTISILVKSGIK